MHFQQNGFWRFVRIYDVLLHLRFHCFLAQHKTSQTLNVQILFFTSVQPFRHKFPTAGWMTLGIYGVVKLFQKEREKKNLRLHGGQRSSATTINQSGAENLCRVPGQGDAAKEPARRKEVAATLRHGARLPSIHHR